jgi:hypothetical protein
LQYNTFGCLAVESLPGRRDGVKADQQNGL